jgi:hypothetical protein
LRKSYKAVSAKKQRQAQIYCKTHGKISCFPKCTILHVFLNFFSKNIVFYIIFGLNL